MKLEEAIDRNKELKGELLREGRLEKAEAIQLDIEALERVKWHKEQHQFGYYELLPGETED